MLSPGESATRERVLLDRPWRFAMDRPPGRTSSRWSPRRGNSTPTWPAAFVNFMTATPERDVISDLFDELLLNRYLLRW